ncbi:MAG: hypothetical protein LDL39_11420 [Magnetospirillum sp.]|nr:hypothetical protein [Magnetospirillum sp.]
MTLLSSGAQAGVLKISSSKEKFFDWDFAQRVWDTMNTWDKEEAEWAKYAADFDPWFRDEWKKKGVKALEGLKNYPAEKRKNIERGFDMQLAWDTWYDHFYWQYIDYYRVVTRVSPRIDKLEELKPFEARLANANAHRAKTLPSPCIRKRFLQDCGAWPDWRSPEMKAEEKKLEAMRDERIKKLKGH